MNWADLHLLPALPEVFLLGALCAILVIDLFISDKNRNLTAGMTLLTLAICAGITVMTWEPYAQTTFSGMFIDDPLSDLSKLGLYIAVATTLIYGRQYVVDNALFRGEFYTLTLFALLGMMIMVSSSHFLTLYIGLELLSLALYALIALKRDSVPALEAAMKYFVLGALASGLLLYGMSMVYGATGSLYLSEVSASILGGEANAMLLVFGTVFIVAGLAFKLGAVPFHMWVPDVYHGAPLAVTLHIGAAPKIAALVFVVRILGQGLEGVIADWQMMLALLALASFAVGNITAIAQTNLKRMLAYSTMSHMGFVLAGILTGTPDGYSGALFYTLTYVLMTLAAFGILLLLSRQGVDCDTLDSLKGLNQKNSWYAFLMLLVMFSMAGIPPLVGFYAKFAVLKSLVSIGLVWLAVAGVVFSLIGAFYYLRVVKVMYFAEPVDDAPLGSSCAAFRTLLSVNALALFLLGIVPDGLLSLCIEVIKQSALTVM